jgi:glycosyltransferase 2 family protein
MMDLFERRWLRRALQSAVTLAAFAYLYTRVDTRELGRALSSVSRGAWLLALLLTIASLGCGVLRWWLLFRAFGALRQPSLAKLAKHYIAGFFYNTYLPGGVSGDVIRGLAARDAWPPGSVGSLASVLVERALGLAALLGLTASATLAHPLPGMARLWLPAIAAFVAVVCATLAVSFGSHLARFVTGPVQRMLQRLPVPSAWLPLWAALLLSFVTQLMPALSGYVLIKSIVPDVSLADTLVIVPLASAAAFLPLTISGAGVRETLFVELFGLVGVPAQAALAGSLSLWMAQAALAAVGGIYSLAFAAPLREPKQPGAA